MMNIHGPSLGIGAGIAVISILAAFFAMDTLVDSQQPLVLEEVRDRDDEAESFSGTTLTANGSPYLGDENAPITLVEFGDYQCFFCNKFFHDTENGILENYVKTGKVKIIFKDYTIIGPDSITAALGAHCAGDQGKFWEFHDILYNNWNGENNGWASSENVKGFATELNLDVDKFTTCLDDKRHQAKIVASGTDAQKLGLTGTPAFFIINSNNQVTPIQGAQPYEVFERLFDAALQ
jgi:protein-disulfide isomerase